MENNDSIKSFPSHDACIVYVFDWITWEFAAYQFKFLLCVRLCMRALDCLTAIKLLWISHRFLWLPIHVRLPVCVPVLAISSTQVCFAVVKCTLCVYVKTAPILDSPSMTWQRTYQLCFEALENKYPLALFMLKRISVSMPAIGCLPFSAMKSHIIFFSAIFTATFYRWATALYFICNSVRVCACFPSPRIYISFEQSNGLEVI